MAIQIIPENRRKTTTESLLQGLGSAVERAPEFVEAFATRKRREAENAKLQSLGIDVTGIEDPNLRSMIAENDLMYRNRQRQIDRENALYNPLLEGLDKTKTPGLTAGGMDMTQASTPEPKKEDFDNLYEQVVYGNLQEASTKGKTSPIPAPSERKKLAKKLSDASQNTNNPISVPQALEMIDADVARQIEYNKTIQEQKDIQTGSQQRYNQIADNILQQILGKYSDPEIQAYFQKKGEEYAGRLDSEAKIKQAITKDAVALRNEMSRIKEGLSAKRIIGKAFDKISGTYRSTEQQIEDAKRKIKPLLDKGFFAQGRQLLSESGWMPEEREEIMGNKIGENAQKIINSLPTKQSVDVQKFMNRYVPRSTQQQSLEDRPAYKALQQILTANPQENLILLRKEFENRGIDWSEFKDILNALQEQGIGTEQPQFQTVLEEPPLDRLASLAYELGFTGR